MSREGSFPAGGAGLGVLHGEHRHLVVTSVLSAEPALLPAFPGKGVPQKAFLSAGNGQLDAPDWRARGRGQTADGRPRCLQNEPIPDAGGHSTLTPKALGKVLKNKGDFVAVRNVRLSGRGRGALGPKEVSPERHHPREKRMRCGRRWGLGESFSTLL